VRLKRPFAALFLAAALLAACLPTAAASAPELSISAPSGPVRAGEDFEVTVELSGGAEICAAQFTLSFDPNAMACEDASAGPLLADALSASNPNAPRGAAVAAAAADPVRGSGVLGSFRFKAKTGLEKLQFALTDVLLAGPEGNEIEVSTPSVFSDTEGHWAREAIQVSAVRGLLGGCAGGTFRPEQPVTRGEMAAVLWRAAGKPKPASAAPFKDLAELDEETREAAAWGYGAGLLSGSDAFSPNAALTRQAAMTLLFGYAGGQAGLEALFYGAYDGSFTDSARIADWARPAVYWGVYHEILTGNSQSALEPEKPVTRAQLAVLLVRCLDRGIL